MPPKEVHPIIAAIEKGDLEYIKTFAGCKALNDYVRFIFPYLFQVKLTEHIQKNLVCK